MREDTVNKLNRNTEGRPPEEVLSLVIAEFGDKIAFASSMGAEDQVITHMLANTHNKTKIFTLDTGRLFPETYELMERTSRKYGINIEVYFPDNKRVEEMVRTKGINLFYRSIENRKLCCYIRKIEQIGRAHV